MKQTTPNTMRAAAIDRFGGIETITMQTLPVPEVGPEEVLIRVESAGVGAWDPFEREGGFAKRFGTGEKFPYVLGTDGAGTVVQVGEQVNGFKEGDRVYAAVLANPKGGFYAEFAAVKADNVSHVPDKLTTEQAGVVLSDALTALQGLDDMLGLQPGETLLIFGAGGGIGHLAVQLAKRMGARVLALASGEDGVALARRLGADVVVNGRKDDVASAARALRPPASMPPWSPPAARRPIGRWRRLALAGASPTPTAWRPSRRSAPTCVSATTTSASIEGRSPSSTA